MLNGGPETGIARPGCTKRSITRRGGSVDRRQSSRNSKRTSFRRARSAPRFLRVHVIDRAAKHAYSGPSPSRPAPPAKNGPNLEVVPREARLLGALGPYSDGLLGSFASATQFPQIDALAHERCGS